MQGKKKVLKRRKVRVRSGDRRAGEAVHARGAERAAVVLPAFRAQGRAGAGRAVVYEEVAVTGPRRRNTRGRGLTLRAGRPDIKVPIRVWRRGGTELLRSSESQDHDGDAAAAVGPHPHRLAAARR